MYSELIGNYKKYRIKSLYGNKLTLNSVANQYRMLKQQFGNLARTIGNLFLPIVEKVLPVVNGLVIAMKQLLESFGISLWGDNWRKDIMGGTSAGYTDDSLENLGDDAEDLGENLDDASKSAKKLKNNLIGIDKLNIISPQDDSGDGDDGAGSEIDLSKQIAGAVADYEKVWEEAFKRSENLAQKYADRIINAFKTGDWESVGQFFSTKLSNALSNIPWDSIYSNAKGFGKGLADFLNGLITPKLFKQLGKTIANSINTVLHSKNAFYQNIKWSQMGTALADGIKSFLENWDAGLTGETLSSFASGLLAACTSAIRQLAENNSFEALGQRLVDFICGIDWGSLAWNLYGFFHALAQAMGEFPSDLLSGIAIGILEKIYSPEAIEKAKPQIEEFKKANDKVFQWFATTGTPIQGLVLMPDEEGLKKSVNNIKKWYNNDVKPWFTKERWKELYDSIKVALQEKWGEIVEWWDSTGVPKWFNNNVKPWFTKERWKSLYDNMRLGLKEKWNEIVKWWNSSGFVNWYNNDVKPWFTKDKWDFSGIEEALKQAWNNAIETIKQTWNKFAEWLNEKLKFSWEDVKIAGKTIIEGGDIILGKIPTFQTGGFPEDGLFFANHNELVGEFSNGKTAVANNAQITAGIEEAAYRGMVRALASGAGNFNSGTQRIEIPVILNGKEIARVVNNENARSGAKMLGYGTGYN